MDFDFAALLVGLSALTGVIWGIDALFFAKARQKAAEGRSEGVAEPVVVEYARSFFPVIVIVLIFRSFLAEPFKIPSGSMMPTLLVGDFILVNKFAYGLRLPVLDTKILAIGEPNRGDVVVFRYPVDPRQDYIKRVIGLPGDEITYRGKKVFINGTEVAQTYMGTFVGAGAEGRNMTGADIKLEKLPEIEHEILQIPNLDRGKEGVYKVPAGQYFVMGDNRDNSQDSRYWGFVPEQNLVGRAFVIWFNWTDGPQFKRIGTLIK
jgi:signal peptidase I